jgi:hypothetical protein
MKTSQLVKAMMCALALGVVNSQAMINITWNWDEQAAVGITLSDGETFLPADSIVQLIFTTGTTIAPVDFADPLAIPAGDSLIATGSTGVGFYILGPANYGAVGDFVGGYVYHRVFTADAGPNTGEFGLGTKVWGDSITGLATSEGSTVFSFLFDSSEPAYSSGFAMTAIPEPSVMALMGLGGLLIAIRRRRMIA